jgi:cytoskeletal protein CcmA (bactofilin family)
MNSSSKGIQLAIQSPFFNKRDGESSAKPVTPVAPAYANTSPGYGGSQQASAANPAGNLGSPAPLSASGQPKESASKLTVGPNIKLKGVEITDCDTLVVEGTVEATMDSRLMQIAEAGAFNGTAEIDIAEIHGTFDGNLTVRQKLVIYSTGKVTGKIRYGKVVIEEGGQLSGEIQFGASGPSSTARPPVAKPALQAIG